MATASASRVVTRAWLVTLAAAGLSALGLLFGGGLFSAGQTVVFLLLAAWIYQGSRIALVTVLVVLLLIALHSLKLYFHGDGVGALAFALLLGFGAATMVEALRSSNPDISNPPRQAGDDHDAA